MRRFLSSPPLSSGFRAIRICLEQLASKECFKRAFGKKERSLSLTEYWVLEHGMSYGRFISAELTCPVMRRKLVRDQSIQERPQSDVDDTTREH